MSNPHHNPHHPNNNNASSSSSSSSSTSLKQSTFFHASTELADLGRERFDQDTAAVGDRDFALYSRQPVVVKQGRAPKGRENEVFSWNTFHYTTEERDDREELKGDLHEGQLHRQNRAARERTQPEVRMGDGGGGGGGGGGGRGRGARGSGAGRGAREREDDGGQGDALRAGKKPEYDAPPLAKGYAEELDKSMFWDGPIV